MSVPIGKCVVFLTFDLEGHRPEDYRLLEKNLDIAGFGRKLLCGDGSYYDLPHNTYAFQTYDNMDNPLENAKRLFQSAFAFSGVTANRWLLTTCGVTAFRTGDYPPGSAHE
jgi:hypothetical protein